MLGRLGIQKDILAETAYGGEQGLMQAVVQILTSLLDVTTKIYNFIANISPKKVYEDTVDVASRALDHIVGTKPNAGQKLAMKMLTGQGFNQDAAAALVGNMMQESTMNPLARNGSHIGLMQWDKTRQAAFAKQFGYQMGAANVSTDKQFADQVAFAVAELRGTHKSAADRMAAAKGLMGKVGALMQLDEGVNDGSFGRRLLYAMQMSTMGSVLSAAQAAKHIINSSSETNIGDIHVHTNATDPAAHADAVRKGIATHPLVDPASQATISLATRGMTG